MGLPAHLVTWMAAFLVDRHQSVQTPCPIYIYNSVVVTCRHIFISTSASELRNATKIAVKKVSDVDVSMFGPEL